MKNVIVKTLSRVVLMVAFIACVQVASAQCIMLAGGFGGCVGTVQAVDAGGNIYTANLDLASGNFCPTVTNPPITLVGVVVGGIFYQVPSGGMLNFAPGTGPVPCPNPLIPSPPHHEIGQLHWQSTPFGDILHIN